MILGVGTLSPLMSVMRAFSGVFFPFSWGDLGAEAELSLLTRWQHIILCHKKRYPHLPGLRPLTERRRADSMAGGHRIRQGSAGADLNEEI